MPKKLPMLRVVPRAKSVRRQTRPSASQRGYCDARHKAWRLAVLNRDAWECRHCGRVCGNKREAHADHISPVVPGTEVCEDGRSRYDLTVGQCLCAACHGRKTATLDQPSTFGRAPPDAGPYR